ncbi:11969_t:CDS:10 [Dentiscutata heterogama]|uniref:11969_t:CDS:1 n=1 Tax=Dentiscutata heterogama TaxID=1316150 RepID=A0ACA9M6Y2_9GLOM|nr:11969_t:CDS:10 [Dentiscutata heterogama]
MSFTFNETLIPLSQEGYDTGGGSSDNFKSSATIRAVAGFFAITATLLSAISVWSHLKHYKKPLIQRYVVRIILMVPIYAVSSWISLTSTNAAFYVDCLRDMYEAFVIYCFFNLLVNYIGGERALLTLLHGRPPTSHLFPVNLFFKEMDVGDPYTFLFLKRGILQYVYIKPVLAISTMILKWSNMYDEGLIELTNEDLKPYRPIPKFLCVKSVIFFSFWQGFALSILVYLGIIRDTESNSAQNISVSIQDFLITFEMLIAAFAHWYAFSYKDYADPSYRSGRMPIKYAFKDCMGFRDVIEDTLETIRGSRFNYRTFEPAEGMAHTGPSRTARIMAGLRFTGGGAGKYWLPGPNSTTPLLSRQMDDDRNSLNFHDPDPNHEVPESTTSETTKKEDHVQKEIKTKRKGKQQHFSSSNVPPFRDGCVDLVREVKDGKGKRLESFADSITTSPHGSPLTSIMQPYESILARDPFIQEPIVPRDVPRTLPISIVNQQEVENNNDIDDPLAINRSSYLSTSLEKNNWSNDVWK